MMTNPVILSYQSSALKCQVKVNVDLYSTSS